MIFPFLITLLVSYLLFLLVLILGWNRRGKASIRGSTLHKISVIIPFRNEEKNIQAVLQSIMRQEYANYEVILVDDHSEDNTSDLIKSLIDRNPGFSNKITLLRNADHGKKAALTTGIISAQGEIIVTTDADSKAGEDWLTIINSNFNEQTKMVVGAVRIQQNGKWFGDLQAIEFSSLIGSAAALLSLGFPTMCNGANLAFRKSVFGEVGGYYDNMHIPSGDDEFLMRKIVDRYPDSIRFINQPMSVVSTQGARTLNDFFNQRLRWAGKLRYNSSIASKVIAFYVALIQISLIISFFAVPINPIAMGSLLVGRFLLEGFFLFNVCSFLGVRWNWSAFIFLQFMYPFYVFVVGLASNFMAYSWKQRSFRQSVS